MAENSAIEWTHHTFNPWRGCTKVSPGCEHCYAEKGSKRNPGVLGVWGPNGKRVLAAASYWKQPERWNREAEAAGERRRVFCASLADVFEDWDGEIVDTKGERLFWPHNAFEAQTEWVPARETAGDEPPVTMGDVRQKLFALIDRTPWLDWLLLTKRPERILQCWPETPGFPASLVEFDAAGNAVGYKQWERTTQLMYRPNVWLLTSVEDQRRADERIPHLLRCRDLVFVLGLSCEPLLGPVDLTRIGGWPALRKICDPAMQLPDGTEVPMRTVRGRIDWVIVGGESGPNARPCDVQHVTDIVDHCQAAGVPVFVKQLGSRPVNPGDATAWPNHDEWGYDEDGGPGVTMRLRSSKGGDPAEWPAGLRVREFPSVEVPA